MKLWLISQSVNLGYDTYDSAVVAAETEEDARNTYPSIPGVSDTVWTAGEWFWELTNGNRVKMSSDDWTIPSNVEVEFLADNYEGAAGTVCASFNAG